MYCYAILNVHVYQTFTFYYPKPHPDAFLCDTTGSCCQTTSAKNPPTASKKVVSGVSYSQAKLSASSRSVIVSFFTLDRVNKISYMLSYTGSGQAQGVGGTITPSSTTDSRDLYFGTCSKGVCTPHYTIKNAKLTVTASLKSGGTRTKRYILRPKW